MSLKGQNVRTRAVSNRMPHYPCERTSSSPTVTSEKCPNTGPLLVHSITLSALATSAGGTESPSCLAVLRLMDNSNLVTW